MSTKITAARHQETVDEFLARGGRIERIEHYPDPDGRVLLRGQRERQQQFNPRFSRPATVVVRPPAS